jgi:hypothetical protein
MRASSALLLSLAATCLACGDPAGPSSGLLVISTRTDGSDPDTDGFQLTIDGADTVALLPTGTVERSLPVGAHALKLLGVAEHCSAITAVEIEVRILPDSPTPVEFRLDCPGAGAQVSVETTGLDVDPDGYRVIVDGVDRGGLPVTGSLFTPLEAGDRTIVLTGIEANCSVEGTASRTLPVVRGQVQGVEFAVTCTATTGVIGVTVSGVGVGARFEASVDATTSFLVSAGGRVYSGPVEAGDHVVSLRPLDNCTVETPTQTVSVATGGLVRDTVEVTFETACPTAFRVTVETDGTPPVASYRLWLCTLNDDYYCRYGARKLLGEIEPDGSLLVAIEPGTYRFFLTDTGTCQVYLPNPTRDHSVASGALGSVQFRVDCP